MEEHSQTYAYETNPDSEELLKIKREELKELKKKAEKDKRFRLAKKSEMRTIRDDRIERINLKLKTIKKHMVYYNRAGKKEKDGIDIFGKIRSLIDNDVELAEDIERTKQKVIGVDIGHVDGDISIEELESEAFVEPKY